jgi:hypothetical protein
VAKKRAQRNLGGRPHSLANPKVRAAFIKALLVSRSKKKAAAMAGICYETVRAQRRRDKAFDAEVKQAEIDRLGSLEEKMLQHALAEDGDWRATAHVLAVNDPKWAKDKDVLRFKDLVRFCAQLGKELAARLPAEHHTAAREVIDRLVEQMLLGGGGGAS